MEAKIVVLGGDGIGPEITNVAVSLLRAVAHKFGHTFHFDEQLIGGIAIDKTGSALPDATLAACKDASAVLLGAVGYYLLTREVSFYRYIEPFWMFTFHATTGLWIGLGALLIASVFVRNLYCRFLCPVGAALGLLSTLTVFRIARWSECDRCKLCEKTCEWGAIRQRKILVTECVRCDDCERLYRDRARCPHWLLDAKRMRREAESSASPAFVEHRIDATRIGRRQRNRG